MKKTETNFAELSGDKLTVEQELLVPRGAGNVQGDAGGDAIMLMFMLMLILMMMLMLMLLLLLMLMLMLIYVDDDDDVDVECI